MEIQKQEIKQLCSKFMLTGMGSQLEKLVNDAEKQQIGFMQFTLELLQSEADHRQSKDQAKRMKAAGLPKSNDLKHYDAEKNGLKTTRMAQLRELNWIDQLFNIVLMGPSGTGKTYLAAGLAADAVKQDIGLTSDPWKTLSIP